MISEMRVTIDGAPATNPSTMVGSHSVLDVRKPQARFASRGGDKLDGAIEDLLLDVTGKVCLDAGAGSGGFTDCLLQRGASRVTAVDVGYGQFEWRLRVDPRVTLMERTNIKQADGETLGTFDLIVADLSFISLRSVIPALVRLSGDRCDWVLLVKPQFEAQKRDVGVGGIVDDPLVWERVLVAVGEALVDAGVGPQASVASRLKGAKGNQEFFMWAKVNAAPVAGAATQGLGLLR